MQNNLEILPQDADKAKIIDGL